MSMGPVLGESAGGGIALSVTCGRATKGVRQPDAVVLVSPLTDLAAEGASLTERAQRGSPADRAHDQRMGGAFWLGGSRSARRWPRRPMRSSMTCRHYWSWWASEKASTTTPRRLAEKVRAAGGDVELEVGEGQLHIFPVFDFLPEARAATDRIGSFLDARFSRRPSQADGE